VLYREIRSASAGWRWPSAGSPVASRPEPAAPVPGHRMLRSPRRPVPEGPVITMPMTPGEEHEFCTRPENQEPQGLARRRRPVPVRMDPPRRRTRITPHRLNHHARARHAILTLRAVISNSDFGVLAIPPHPRAPAALPRHHAGTIHTRRLTGHLTREELHPSRIVLGYTQVASVGCLLLANGEGTVARLPGSTPGSSHVSGRLGPGRPRPRDEGRG
jgi:hypothetical protein